MALNNFCLKSVSFSRGPTFYIFQLKKKKKQRQTLHANTDAIHNPRGGVSENMLCWLSLSVDKRVVCPLYGGLCKGCAQWTSHLMLLVLGFVCAAPLFAHLITTRIQKRFYL